MPITRRAFSRPSVAVLTAVSGVFIIDEAPPVAANAAPFGNTVVVGEFEDGPFNTVTPILTSRDMPRIFGGLGYDYGGKRFQFASAVRSGGTEPFNGSGYVQTARLPFGKLSVCRVDTSVGQVAMTPLAYVQAAGKLAPFDLEPAQTFIWERDGVTRTATFAATAATRLGVGATYPTSFVGGEQISVAHNGATTVVTFQPGDTSLVNIISRINAAFGFTFASNSSGQLLLTSNRRGTGSTILVTAGTTATALGLPTTLGSGTGDAADIDAVTAGEVATKVAATDAGSVLRQAPDGSLRIVSLTGGTGTVRVLAGTANDGLGFTDQTGGAVTDSGLKVDVLIRAGVRLKGAAGDATRVVTMQSETVAKGSKSTVLKRVRPAVDDGTYAGVAIAGVTIFEDQPGDQEWSVGNPVALTAALTAAQLDAAYLAAIAATVGTSTANTKKLNAIVSARQSNAIRAALVSNALSTSTGGHYDRRAFVCPPNGTSAQAAIAATAPGVGAYRDESVCYAVGGVRTVLQELLDGGYVTESSPEIIRHPDTFLSSRYSSLGAGLNPAQYPEDPLLRFDQTTFPGLETAATSWDITTYIAFKSAGVCGAQFDPVTGLVFGDGVTSVDPAVDPARTKVSRRSLAGLIGDTASDIAGVELKRQATETRVDNTRTKLEGFLETIKEPVGELIDDYSVTDTPGDAPGIFEFAIAARQTDSMDTIVINLRVGTTVEISR